MASTKLILLVVLTVISSMSAKQPHIVMILADDYGWNDVGYHGNPEVKTPNIDQLAADGIKLENYYVQPQCTPTRSQLMSGKYQIHTGLQHSVFQNCRPAGLPLDDPTLADQLKVLGYKTHAVGKWHLGYFKKEYTPIYRGFDTHFGFLGGMEDYYNRTYCRIFRLDICGIDFQENGRSTSEYVGPYATNLFTDRAEEIINSHNSEQPMFLYMSYNAPHSPLQVPESYLKQFENVTDETRRIYLAMVAAMDEGIGNITSALKQNQMWEDTIIIFMADNGGSKGFGADNSPLRGDKATYLEGGIRAVAFLSGNFINNSGEVNNQLLHVSDWYPTLMNLAGGNSLSVRGLDGYDQWKTITENATSARYEILINIDPMARKKGETISNIFDTSVSSALRHGDWKILTGELKDHETVSIYPASFWPARITTTPRGTTSTIPSTKNVYLYNIAEDPEESRDVSSEYPEIVDLLLGRLAYYNSTAVAVIFPDPENEKCDPAQRGGFWGPYIEDPLTGSAVTCCSTARVGLSFSLILSFLANPRH